LTQICEIALSRFPLGKKREEREGEKWGAEKMDLERRCTLI